MINNLSFNTSGFTYQIPQKNITLNKFQNTSNINLLFTGNEKNKKSNITMSLAYIWAKINSFNKPESILISGEIDKVKELANDGTIFIFAPKHYDNRDIPSLVKLCKELTTSRKAFNDFYPHLMRAKRSKSRTNSVLNKLDNGMGCFMVNTSGKGNGRQALIRGLELLSEGNHIMLFPEGGSGLKYKGQPVSKQKQQFQPIKNGLSHIVTRLLSQKTEGLLDEDLKIAVIPIGISGEDASKGHPATLHVGKPIQIFDELTELNASEQNLYDRIEKLNEVFQKKLQHAQNKAYDTYKEAVKLDLTA